MSFVPKAEVKLEGKPEACSKLIFKIGVVCAIGLFVGMVVYNATTELKVVKVMKYAQYASSPECSKRDDEVYCYNNDNDIVINIASVHAMDEELDFAYDEDQRATTCGDCRASCPANGYVREFGISEPFEENCVLCTLCTVCSSACLVDSTSSKVTLFTRVAEEYIVALSENKNYDPYSVSNFKLIINFAAFLKDEDACSFKLLVGDDIYYSGFENLKILSFAWEPEERLNAAGSLYYLLEGLTVQMEYFGTNAVQTDEFWPEDNVVKYDPNELLPIFLSTVSWDLADIGGQDFSCGVFAYDIWESSGTFSFATDTQTGGASANVNCKEVLDTFAMLFNLEYFARSQSASLITSDPIFLSWKEDWDSDNAAVGTSTTGNATAGGRRLFLSDQYIPSSDQYPPSSDQYSPSQPGLDSCSSHADCGDGQYCDVYGDCYAEDVCCGYCDAVDGGCPTETSTECVCGGSYEWGYDEDWTWDSSWGGWDSSWTSDYLPPSLTVFFDDYYSTDINEALKAPSSWTKSSAYIKALCKASFRLETNKGNVVGFRQETYFPEVVDAMSLALPWTITFWNGCTAAALVIVSKLHQRGAGDSEDKSAKEGPDTA